MFLVNGQRAVLRQYNRNPKEPNAEPSVYDDEEYKDITIKCCPYNFDTRINFEIYTTREATGYYQVPRKVDVKVGDQIKLLGRGTDDEFHTILDVKDEWLFNRIENKVLAVK